MFRLRKKNKGKEECEKKNKDKLVNSSSSILTKLKMESSNPIIKRFNASCDDSSDEEEDEIEYDIDENYKKYTQKNKSKSKGTLADDTLLSFIAHAAGLTMLYSESVSNQYYPLKKKRLGYEEASQQPIYQLYQLVNKAILESLDQTFVLIERFILLSNQGDFSSEKIKKIEKDVKAHFIKNNEDIILSHINIFIEWLDKHKDHDNECKDNILEKFEKYLTRQFAKSYISHLCFDETEHDRVEVKHRLFLLAKARMMSITADFGFASKAYHDGKEEAISLLNQYTGSYQSLIMNVKLALYDCSARGLVKNLIANKLSEKKYANALTKSFIDDLVKIKDKNTEIKKGKRKIKSKDDLSSDEESAFHDYFMYNRNALMDELTNEFQFFLHKNLETDLSFFHRPTLTRICLLESNNPYELMANIRLANRSQKRNGRNSPHSVFKEDTALRSWRLVNASIAEADVSETQKILKASFGRMDRVMGLGNYENVYSCIVEIKKYFQDKQSNITDTDIAIWLRSIFNGIVPDMSVNQHERSEILHKLQSIAYLLFGCEAARNPAMIIINQMLIDLIIGDSQWTFEEAFTGRYHNKEKTKDIKRMPMAPEGAVASARALEYRYQYFMPLAYSYPGIFDESGIQSLVKCEAKVVREWINLKVNQPNNIPSRHLASWVLDLIEGQFEHWFGSPPDEKNSKLRI